MMYIVRRLYATVLGLPTIREVSAVGSFVSRDTACQLRMTVFPIGLDHCQDACPKTKVCEWRSSDLLPELAAMQL